MYEFTPKGSNKSTKTAISALILGGFAIMLVTMTAENMPFKWALQTAAIAVIATGILLMTRYVSKGYTYCVEQKDETLDFSVIEMQGKVRITICRIALSNISEVHVLEASEQDKEKTLVASFKANGQKRFNYCTDFKPEKFIWLVANECGENVAVKLNYDEKLCELLTPTEEHD